MAEPGSGRRPVGRLAPSPTGVLHLGNARSFLLAWLSIRSRGGRVRLRVEDIDGPRVKKEATEQVLEDLRWLGLDWDGVPLLQSTRVQEYAGAATRLVESGYAYPCVCSRREVEEAASAPHEDWHDSVVYPGTCRGRFSSLPEARERTGQEPALRFRVETDRVPFVDGFCGPQEGRVAGDFVIQKRDGAPAYQLAVVVDDAATGIDEVLRGADLLVSTPRQLLLYAALGLAPPAFLHTPLLVGPDGRRLAKRHGDTSLRHFRSIGVTPEQVVGYLARVSGLLPIGSDPRCGAAALLAGFDLTRVPARPVGVGAAPFAQP